jgi:phosphate/sulfate permease
MLVSFVFLVPWIKRNLPTVTYVDPDGADVLEGNGSGSDEDHDGIMMTEPDNEDKSSSDKSSLKATPTQSEDGSMGSLDRTDTLSSGEVALEESKPPPTQTDDAMFCFRVLLVFNAALKSFAHGANDTANATGPFSAVLEIHDYGLDICSDDNRRSPIWIMVMAGAFVALGITTFGHRVITTVGEKLTIVNYHSGFCIELGSSVSVVLATQLGIPVSTTHCQIGAVVGAGLMTSKNEKMHWGLLGKIALTWIITVPFSGLLSVALMEVLRPFFQ